VKFKTSKSCKLCEKDFECNSNAQKYCGDCKGEARLKRNRVYNKAYYRENSDEIDSKHTAYNKGERGKAAEKLRAAVRSGKIERGNCEECGEPNAHGHHPDYSKPLEVIWLCPKHHAEEHTLESWQKDLKKAGYTGGYLLGELIGACGDNFVQLSKDLEGGWWANSGGMGVGGKTPEIAVAKLYIKLNVQD